jgi:hypothetical protein
MKRFSWYLKAGFLCAALLVLFGTTGVTAQDEGMGIEGGFCLATAAACSTSSSAQCFCPDNDYTRGCTGCFIPNGGTGCGTCR